MDHSNQTETEVEDYAKLQKQAEEYLDGWKRAKADYLNLKKQTEREREELIGMAAGALVLDLLPVKTNLDRAWKHLPDDLAGHDWVKGLTQVRAQFDAVLTTLGITVIDPTKQPFDPNQHEAIERAPDPSIPEGHVSATLEPGYAIQGKVIIPAKVRVNQPVDSNASTNDQAKGGDNAWQS
jgi:molecular chaperone GrpE